MIREPLLLVTVVGDPDHGRAGRGEGPCQTLQGRGRVGVERRGALVGPQHVAPGGERAGQAQPLRLAAREGQRVPVEELGAERHAAEQIDRLEARLEARLEKSGLDSYGPDGVKVASADDLIGKGQSFAAALKQRSTSAPGQRGEGVNLGRAISYLASGNRKHLTDVEEKALGGTISPDGGWLLPDAVVGPMIDLARNKARVFEAGAQTLIMPERSIRLPRLEADAAATWRNENAAVTEDDPEFGFVSLNARTLAVMFKVSYELLEDLTSEGYGLVEAALVNGVALGLDSAVLRGTGVGATPLGISSDPLVPDVDTFGTPTSYDLFIDAMTSVWSYNGTPNVAIYSPRTAGTLAKLKTGISGDKTQLIMPREVASLQHLVTNQIPNTIDTDKSEVIVGDFTKVVVGVKPSVSVRVMRHDGPYADHMQALLLAWVRADVALLEPTHFHVTRGVDD